MKQLSQKENKRLKGLDEPTNKQIANKKQLDDIMNELYKTSKTYEHNKKILSIKPEHNKKSLIEKLFIYYNNSDYLKKAQKYGQITG